MIKVKEYRDLCEQITEVTDIKGYVLLSTEDQATKKLRDAAGIRLVAIYPSYSFNGDEDTYKSVHELLLFIIVRQKEGSSEETEINQYADTQDAIIKMKEFLFGEDANSCKLLPNIDVNSVVIDPEYNIFGGYIGWSMKFVC